MHRYRFEFARLEQEHVGFLSDLNTAELVGHTYGFRPAVGGHGNGLRCGDAGRVAGESFLDKGRKFKTFDIVGGVVACRTVGAYGHGHSGIKTFTDWCRTRSQIHVGHWIVAYGHSVICESLDFIGCEIHAVHAEHLVGQKSHFVKHGNDILPVVLLAHVIVDLGLVDMHRIADIFGLAVVEHGLVAVLGSGPCNVRTGPDGQHISPVGVFFA